MYENNQIFDHKAKWNFFSLLATGIARSVTPGQALRGVAYTPNLTSTSGESTATPDTQVTYPHFPTHSTLI